MPSAMFSHKYPYRSKYHENLSGTIIPPCCWTPAAGKLRSTLISRQNSEKKIAEVYGSSLITQTSKVLSFPPLYTQCKSTSSLFHPEALQAPAADIRVKERLLQLQLLQSCNEKQVQTKVSETGQVLGIRNANTTRTVPPRTSSS